MPWTANRASRFSEIRLENYSWAATTHAGSEPPMPAGAGPLLPEGAPFPFRLPIPTIAVTHDRGARSAPGGEERESALVQKGCWMMIARFAATGCLAAVLAAPCAAAAERVVLGLDEAEIVRLDQPASTIIVGNPAIADALVQSPELIVVTGKSYGTTNLIVLDSVGEKVGEFDLQVGNGGGQSTVTVQRGGVQYSYSCTPTCNGTLVPGDQKDAFDALQKQVEGRMGLSRGQIAQ